MSNALANITAKVGEEKQAFLPVLRAGAAAAGAAGGALAAGARSLAAPALAAGAKVIGPTATKLVGGAVNAAKGYTGLGTARGVGGAVGTAANMGPTIGHSLTSGSGPSVMGMKLPGFKGASAADSVVLKRAALQLAKLGPSEIADVASYGAFLGAKLVDPVKHPYLHTALDAGGLLGLAGTTAYGMTQDRAERVPGLKDIAGLALMGSALYDRAKAHGH